MALYAMMEMHARKLILVNLESVLDLIPRFVTLKINATWPEPVTLKPAPAPTLPNPMALHAMTAVHARKPILVKQDLVLDLILWFVLPLIHATWLEYATLLPVPARTLLPLMVLHAMMEMHAPKPILVKLELVLDLTPRLALPPINATSLEHAILLPVSAPIQTKPITLHAMMEMHARKLIHVNLEPVLDLTPRFVPL